MKIFIDAGHNYSGGDTGAIGNGLKEQNITFGIADKLKTLLVNAGHIVEMSRNNLTDNIGSTLSQSLKKRAELSNIFKPDLFVSIHANAGGGKGTEVLVYSKNSGAFSYAQKVQKAIVDKMKTVDRGVKERPELGVLRMTHQPAILVETAFIDNANDALLLKNKQQEFAEAIFTGITGVAPSVNTNNTPVEIISVNDIVWELANRGILSDRDLWLKKLDEDVNSYHLAKKTVKYLMEKNV